WDDEKPHHATHDGAPTVSVQLQSNSRGWLHRVRPRKRHQMRHLFDFARFLAKQVLSQLSYTPTFGVTFILKHFRAL
ncbi:MAG TPA: hypothetical protein VNO32_65305, partial [Candidatus Acidoferrum sp.]|nr:hypothetical protein [Candidatus Acidoferrum sp.]